MAQKRNKISREQVSSTRRKKHELAAADAKHFRELLLEKRREILKNVTEFEDEALNMLIIPDLTLIIQFAGSITAFRYKVYGKIYKVRGKY